MIVAGLASGSFAGVPRNNSAESLFPFDFSFSVRRKIWMENLIPDVCSLMRSLLVIVSQPFTVYGFQLIQTHADKMVQTLPFYLSDIALDVRIRHSLQHEAIRSLFEAPDRIERMGFDFPVSGIVFQCKRRLKSAAGGGPKVQHFSR